MDKIKMYGTAWCPDCLRAKQFFKMHNVSYDWVDITEDEKAAAYVEQVNGGYKSVPTILFPDGTTLVEPSNAALQKKLETIK
jgi:mycoredoxin